MQGGWIGRFDERGRILVTGTRPAGGSGPAYEQVAVILARDAIGLRRERIVPYPEHPDFPSLGTITGVPGDSSGTLILEGEDPPEHFGSFALRLNRSEWEGPRDFPLPGARREHFLTLRRNSRDEAWYWANADTLYHLLPGSPGERGRTLPLPPIQWSWVRQTADLEADGVHDLVMEAVGNSRSNVTLVHDPWNEAAVEVGFLPEVLSGFGPFLKLQTEWTEAEPRSLYAPAAGPDSGGARMPMPGDTVLVTTATLRGWARFARYETIAPHRRSEYVDPTRASAVFELGAARVQMPLPVASLVSVRWPDGTTATGADLVRFLGRGVPSDRLPAERQILYISTQAGDTVAASEP